MELIIGSHVNFVPSTQLVGSINEMLSYGANACMIYTGAPLIKIKKMDEALLRQADEMIFKYNIDKNNIIVHAPFINNPSNDSDLSKYKFTLDLLRGEIDKCIELGIKKLVLHPGSHVGLGVERGIKNTINTINAILKEEDDIIICVESMSGKGSEVGRDLNELKAILDGIDLADKVGICLDTCHLSDSGVDITKFDEYLDEFDALIGIDKIQVFHINDSKNELGSAKDRHENIGYGHLGFDALISIIYNERLKDVPKILETPMISLIEGDRDRTLPPYKYEIEMIREKKFNLNLHKDIRENVK